MKIHTLIIAAGLAGALASAAAVPARAQDVGPIQSQAINLDGVTGDVYYTVERDGFHVVATLAERGDRGLPVRLKTIMAPGQTVVLSTPRGVGEASDEVEITRQANHLLVHKAALVD